NLQFIQVAFRAYDLNSDGVISREEMFQLLKASLIRQPTDEDPDEGIRDLVDLVLKRLDMDHDGKVTYPDFQSAVQQDAMLLEILGPCFPEEQVAVAFLSTFQEIQIPNSICFIRPNNPAVMTKTG
ncbi:uncharacterized protein DEA37_0013422, partial [Paragonimus westermani]